jgi:hypothetical protein
MEEDHPVIAVIGPVERRTNRLRRHQANDAAEEGAQQTDDGQVAKVNLQKDNGSAKR